MKHKFLFLFFATIVVMNLFAEKVKIGDLYYNLNASNKTAEVTAQNSRSPYWSEELPSANIPASVNYDGIDYSVTSIGVSAFRECNLTSTIIPNSVTSIGAAAFSGCSGLTSVTIPNSVISIGDHAFGGCSGLTSIEIPNSTTSIGDWAFYNCSGLTSVTIPNSVRSIGDAAFLNCTSLTKVNITDLTAWCNIAFDGGNSNPLSYAKHLYLNEVEITDLIIPNSVTSIGNYAFYSCKGLTSVTIPNSVTSIGDGAFWYCRSLTSVTIPNSVTNIGEEAFRYCSSLISIYVPCSKMEYFQQMLPEYASLIKYTPLSHKYKVIVNAENGSISSNIETKTVCDDDYNVEFTAIPSDSYHFVKWWDGNTTNPRTIEVNSDISVEAIFAPNPNITYKFDPLFGSVYGPTTTPTGMAAYTITFTAYPVRGCYFVQWKDSITDNPRTIYLDKDTTMTAVFDYLRSGKCGKDSVLSWTFDPSTKALNITKAGSLTENYTYGAFIESLTIGNEITAIGQSAFAEFANLKTVILGASVKVLEENAFNGCTALKSITCYSQRPPTVNQNALNGLDYNTIIYVPADYLNTYKMHDAWGLYDVQPLGAATTQTDEVKVEPTETTAEVAWPSVSGAYTYDLLIKDKNGNPVCTLTFNANGQLTSIAFHAPARNRSQQQTQAAGFSFTVTGLEAGTSYDLTITAKDNNGTTLDVQAKSFTTQGKATAIDEMSTINCQLSTKVVRDGQLLILRDGKIYDMTGKEVK